MVSFGKFSTQIDRILLMIQLCQHRSSINNRILYECGSDAT